MQPRAVPVCFKLHLRKRPHLLSTQLCEPSRTAQAANRAGTCISLSHADTVGTRETSGIYRLWHRQIINHASVANGIIEYITMKTNRHHNITRIFKC